MDKERRIVMGKFIARFLKDETGLETVDYALMAALIVAAIACAVDALATAIQARRAQGVALQ